MLPALPVTDTLKRVAAGAVAGTVERAGLYRAQTPQGFRYRQILAAHRAARRRRADRRRRAGRGRGPAGRGGRGRREPISRSPTPADLARAERLLGGGLAAAPGSASTSIAWPPATASCCSACALPDPLRLIGHSDADVGLHALTDALLGTLGAGDIGSHFPPSEARWAGAEFGAVPRRMRGG